MFTIRIVRLSLLCLWLCVGVFAVACSLLLPGSTHHRHKRIMPVAQFWYRGLLTVLNVKVDVLGQYQHQGALMVSNHISWLDIPVLGSQLPTYFLSKAEVRTMPAVGWLSYHAGTLFIKRGTGDVEQVRSLMKEYLGRDHCLTFFPEATTGNGKEIRQFHPRLFAAAIESQTPVLPIALSYQLGWQPELSVSFGNESMFQNLWRVLGRWRTHVVLQILPALHPEGLDRKTLADTSMHAIADALNLPQERRGIRR